MTSHDIATLFTSVLVQVFLLLILGYFASRQMARSGLLPNQDVARKEQDQAMSNLRALVDTLQARLAEAERTTEQLRAQHQAELSRLRDELASERSHVNALTLKLADAQTALAEAATRFLMSQQQASQQQPMGDTASVTITTQTTTKGTTPP